MKRISIESLEFKDMSFCYDAGKPVFCRLNYTFPRQEVLYFQAPVGGGKNTLIKLLLGLLVPKEGAYLVNGRKVNDFSHAEFDPYRLNIGYSFDVGGLINNLSLYENLKLPLDYHAFMAEEEKRGHILGKLELFNLQDQKHLRPAFVSSGSRKALSLLRAFIMDPEVVILNNPTLGLNSELTDSLVELINYHAREKGLRHILIFSENKQLIQKLPGKVLRLTDEGILPEITIEKKAS